MISDADIHVFVYDPKEFIAFCRKVTDRIVNEYEDDRHQQKERKLESIDKKIRVLERRGLAVPDALLMERDDLEKSIKDCDTTKVIEDLFTGLIEVARDLKTHTSAIPLGHHRKAVILQTSQAELGKLLVESLRELGGSGSTQEVLEAMGQKMEGRFLPGDLEPCAYDKLKWRNNARWARSLLVKQGVLKKNSPHGIWELA